MICCRVSEDFLRMLLLLYNRNGQTRLLIPVSSATQIEPLAPDVCEYCILYTN